MCMIDPESRCVQVVCSWKRTKLHRRITFAVPLLPFVDGRCPSRQREPMTPDTQAVFIAEMLLNIARGSLGGFYIPSDESEPLDDSIFRFTFHGQHPENVQKPGPRLSQEELSMPLTRFLGQVLWIKVKGGLAPTANITNLRMQSTIEDKSNHPSNWVAYIERHYPKEMTRCPFTACLSPITCHIIECGLNNEAFELLMQLSSAIYDIYRPGLQIWDYSGEPGFLDIRYPIVEGNAYAMVSLPAVETHTNGMSLERQFHETYRRYWWLIYRGEAFWTMKNRALYSRRMAGTHRCFRPNATTTKMNEALEKLEATIHKPNFKICERSSPSPIVSALLGIITSY
ncbi:uncharacterized protein EV420DRAFT_6289 [Desarmillaria tabescens]|uniref:Uncharacterized protein n=1 Tax=Armillaria tabescens TaxID=1929756 RepID=A0AA39NNS2_ARMTA|nr:uncharacterized protein EV420DRAFT_6289 [Desarmillaria tabescens]KAK0469057.1 hypothetical protein EV420DRAFT_6289 [Desarmillaria tabescens]